MSELAQGLFFLAPPSREGLREAIVEPAEMAGFRFELPATVEHMLDHLEHTPGALPLLQFAASKLWDLRDIARKLLTEDGYRAIGGIAGALASHADAVVAELPPQRRPLARALFLRLITPERTRAVVPVAELDELAPDPGEVRQLVDQLVHARLLVVQSGDGDGSALAEIVHESLIQSWPRLRRWLDENQDDAAFLEQLRTAARQWQAKGHPVGLLWRGEAMEEARRWHRRYRGELPRLQRAYLDAVFALDARAARRRRYLLAGLMVFLTFLSTAATVALLLIRDAKQEAELNAMAAGERLKLVETKERLRQEAEEGEQAARQAEQRANAELQKANGQLAAQNDQLGDALRRAKRSKARERRARKHAEDAADAAREAEAEAERINKELQAALERERRRVRELERRIGPIIEELAPEDLDVDAVDAEAGRVRTTRESR